MSVGDPAARGFAREGSTIDCVYSLSPLLRWTGTSGLRRSP